KLSESIEEQSNKRSRNVYFITILVTILCIIIAYQISKKITKPIHELSQRCKDVAEGNLSIRVNTIANNDETDILVDSFNDMVERIEDSVFTMQQKVIVEDKLREEQLRNIEMQNLLNQSELKFLRMQINPHFLYNTMNSISALAQIEDAKKTQSMIDSLSSLLRYSLSEISSMVTLADETQITESYLFLQKMRFEDRLNYNINIPEELFSIEMPPMIL
ncbi:MAG: histidine kinase, partial [Eubacteriaceae bacterium]